MLALGRVQVERRDLGRAAPFRLERQEAGSGADVEEALSAEIDVPDVVLEAAPEIPAPLHGAVLRQVERVVEVAARGPLDIAFADIGGGQGLAGMDVDLQHGTVSSDRSDFPWMTLRQASSLRPSAGSFGGFPPRR